MPKVNVIQTNFTAGELTPRMKGRVDVARYQNGAETIENGIVQVHGGVTRRAGLRFCAEAKHAGTRAVYVIRYVFNREQAFVLEFGHLYVRIFDIDGGALLDGGSPIEVASPYTEDQLAEVTYHQGGDTLFLYHPDVPQHRFQRRSSTVWTLQPVPWIVEPFAENGHAPDARLTIDNPAAGTGRTFTTLNITVPGAPTGVTAIPLNGGARVSFTPPADSGGSPITEYEVTSSPGGVTATGAGTTLAVSGLTNGVAYTFTVKARNKAGQGAASAASAPVTPNSAAPLPFITVTAAPNNYYVQVPNGLQPGLDGPIASASTGVGPYTYAWSKLSGSASITITSVGATSAQVRLKSTGYGTTNTAIFRCVVTDSLGAQGTVQVNISVKHQTGSTGVGTLEP